MFEDKILFFIAKSLVDNQNKKASILYLSKEASTKDQNLKTQMMITLNDGNDSQKAETIWKSNGFFKEQRTDLISRSLTSLRTCWYL